MTQTGIKGVRAAFEDARGKLARRERKPDPPPLEKRGGYDAGAWPGAPRDRLPPDCPVIPLGIAGKNYYFVDSAGQLIEVGVAEWGKKMLMALFCATPNYVEWAWPRWAAPKANRPSAINGVEVDEAAACLMKAAESVGLFSSMDVVRGRGAWTDRFGQLIWHSGDALWRVDGGRLKYSRTGEIDGKLYPRQAEVLEPWPEPVSPAESPVREIFKALTSWTWERPTLDPVIVIGGIGAMMLGGALPWRPHIAAMGDWGTGKSELRRLVKAILGSTLHDLEDATSPAIYQRLGMDTLPVALDEFEAREDNRRNVAIVELMRVAASGGRLARGGANHVGVEFVVRNAFFCYGINLPPMRPQDRSRIVILNLGQLKVGDAKPPVVPEEAGRMILRQLMDAWPRFHQRLDDWRDVLRGAGIESRGQDVYGTLFAIGELLLGMEAMEEIGLPVTEAERLGELIAQATAQEREDRTENWRACLEHLMTATVDAWKGGEKPSIGGIFEQLENHEIEFKYARERLAAAGCGLLQEADGELPAGQRKWLLAVPHASPALQKLFAGSRFADQVWVGALRQAPPTIVIRDRSNRQVVKINRVAARCLLVDIHGYDKFVGGKA